MPIEPALLASEGRMPRASQHRASGGHGCPQRASGEMARARPEAGVVVNADWAWLVVMAVREK